jgi:hypothetical protein
LGIASPPQRCFGKSVSGGGVRLWPGFFEIRKKILGRGHKKEILKNIQSVLKIL